MIGRLNVRKVFAQSGKLQYLEGFLEDITERRRAEEAQSESAMKLRNIIDFSPTAIHLYELQGDGNLILVDTNPTADRMMGVKRDGILGQAIETVFPGLQNTGFMEKTRMVARGRLGPQSEELSYQDVRLAGIYDVHVYQTSPGVIILDFDDITRRKQAEAALAESAMKVRSIIDYSPVAMYLYALQADGSLALTDSNPAAERLLGVPLREKVGHGIEEIFPGFVNTGFVEKCKRVAQGELGSQAVDLQYQDARLDGIYDVHVYQSSPGYILVDFVDITERKLTEHLSRARLTLIEFSNTHSIDELLRAALDEAEALTGSRIGFYHFLESDQVTLVLQNWSTSTANEYCKADGKGSHYPVSHAGVWVDCIYARQPVIHNDYHSLPHRKGLPEGHAALNRELVVPVIRGDKIVAIMGVGNKPQDYIQRDVIVVSQLAELTWDVAERKRSEQALKDSEILLNETQTISKAGGWEYDCLTKKVKWTREVYRIHALPEDYDPNNITDNIQFYDPLDQKKIEAAFFNAVTEGQPYDLEVRFINANGQNLWVRTQGNAVIENGKIVKITGNLMDITESKVVEETLRILNNQLESQLQQNEQLQAQLLEQSNHDALTGLYNRRFMDDSLERELARAKRESYPISILMMDIDHFKKLNDSYGHAMGDKALHELGKLLRSAVRESDIPCRYGGEEFIVIMPEAAVKDALNRAELIREQLRGLVLDHDPNLKMTLSIGISGYPHNGTNADVLTRAADAALYAAKNAGRDCVRVAQE